VCLVAYPASMQRVHLKPGYTKSPTFIVSVHECTRKAIIDETVSYDGEPSSPSGDRSSAAVTASSPSAIALVYSSAR